MTSDWPKQLTPARGPIRADKLDGAAAGMGQWGAQTRALANEGLVPPDMMTGLTLFLLSSQKRESTGKQKIPGGGGGVAGGVWVRERFTIHRPLQRDEAFAVSGESVGRHVHKGRRYGTNRCRTLNAAGELAATNLTTGLLAYKVEEGLADALEGQSPDEIDAPQPDWSVAADNPCLAQLKALHAGQEFSGEPVLVGLDLMEARDTKKPDNPIHSDPELAKQAGLAKPIAGGSHVLAFVLEVIMAHAGRHSLLHGANFDIRWKAPVFADLVIFPHVRVAAATDAQVVFEIDATLDSGATAMTGTVTVPLV
jgi:hypothetical protein